MDVKVLIKQTESLSWIGRQLPDGEWHDLGNGTIGTAIAEVVAEIDDLPEHHIEIWSSKDGSPGALVVWTDQFTERERNCWVPEAGEHIMRRNVANGLRQASSLMHRTLCSSTGWNLTGRAANDIEDFLTWVDHDCANCRRALTDVTRDAYWSAGHYIADFAVGLAAQLDANQPVTLAWQSAARNLVEACGQVIWMVDDLSGMDFREQVATRMARLLVLEHKSLAEQARHSEPHVEAQKYYDALTRHIGFVVEDAAKLQPLVRHYAADLSVRLPKAVELLPGLAKVVAEETEWTVADWDHVYGLESGVVHARPYRMRSFRRSASNEFPESARTMPLTLAATQVALNRLGSFVAQNQPIKGYRELHRDLRRRCDDLEQTVNEMTGRAE